MSLVVTTHRFLIPLLVFTSLPALLHRQTSAEPATQPTAPRYIEIDVVDDESRRPLEEAVLTGNIVNDVDEPVATSTPAHFRVEVPVNADSYITITARAPGRMPVAVSWVTKKPLPEKFTIPLPKGMKIGGRVVDADGKPVEGATVVLNAWKEKTQPPLKSGLRYHRVTTDADGRWAFDGAPALSDYRFDLGVYHLQRGGQTNGYYAIMPVKDESQRAALRDGAFESWLEPARRITGRVVDADGKPIEGARIGIGSDRIASNVLPEIKTDAEGNFSIGGTPDASIPLTFKAKGFGPAMITVRNSVDAKPIVQKMHPAQMLEARVVDTAGNPIPKAWFYIEGMKGGRSLNVRLDTDAEGRVRWTEAPAEAVSVDVVAEGFADARDLSLSPGAERTVMLTRPVTFHGKVIDAETKQPVKVFATEIGLGLNGSGQHHFSDVNTEKTKPTGDGTFELTFSFPYPTRVVRVVADGYAPLESTPFKMSDVDPAFTFELKRSEGLSGVVQKADGTPAGGVVVYFVSENATFENGQVPEYDARTLRQCTTDPSGVFKFPPTTGAFILVATADAGIGSITNDSFNPSTPIKLAPFAKVRGTARIGSKPAANVTIRGWRADGTYEENRPNLTDGVSTKTDSEGRFELPRVAPGRWSIGRQIKTSDNSTSVASSLQLEVTPGQTHDVTIGGGGRPVSGRTEIPPELSGRSDWMFLHASLTTLVEFPKQPEWASNAASMTEEERKLKMQTDEWKQYIAEFQKAQLQQKQHYGMAFADGRYSFDDIPPGSYKFQAQIYERPEGNTCGFGAQLGNASIEKVEVPAGDSEVPFELPSATVTIRRTLALGQQAPAFDLPTLDGGRVTLDECKGKIVVLDFWATWCGPCVAEVPHLKTAYERFKDNPKVVFISVSLDNKQDQPRDFAKKNGMNWTQAFLGQWNKTNLPNEYGVYGIPAVFVIDGEGKVRAKGIRGGAVEQEVSKALMTN